MESDLTDIYGFGDFPKYLEDDVFDDKIDDMLTADIDMEIFDKLSGFHSTSSAARSPPILQSISSPTINPDDFLNDVDGEDVLTTSSDRSSPSLSNSPSSPSSSFSLDNIKHESSSDESVNTEGGRVFQSYVPPTVAAPTPIFQQQNGAIRILQGTLIPVSTIKIEAPSATVKSVQPLVLATSNGCPRVGRNKVVLPKLDAASCHKSVHKTSQQPLIEPVDEKALKKQLRMIKNRESASISRTKKRQYVMSLETQVKSLLVENSVLKNENNNLKAQISNMLATCQCRVAQYSYITKTISPQSRKNAAILLAMIFMVSMSVGNFNSLLSRNAFPQEAPLSQHSNDKVGRSLLWTDESIPSSTDSSLRNITRTVRCLSALNQTENSRIETDLRNWIGINEELNTTYSSDDMTNFMSGFHGIFNPNFKSLYRAHKNYFKRKNPHLNQDWLQSKKRRFNGQQAQRAQRLKNQMQLFYPSRRNRSFSKLFEEIGRRNDTFYVLSFNNDHLLLSAANHNKTARPKMSFVLPADDSFQNDKVTLMQIDCEVLNTSIIELKKEFIPQHLRTPSGAGTGANAQRNSTRTFNVPNKYDIFEMANRSTRREAKEKDDYNKIYKPYFIDKPNFAKEAGGDYSEVFLT
ncbi:unnamed protein product [Hermetia illucens]|uniref:BZIP domain-containing protein n=1 Tax=Hermetia illucens TaxID=343691 RepID=A0A7R8UET8_HERIL|nr:cyclic AMP-dependent transcription factor ATF-6 alpha [Hermetia illucens]CAD7079466.1 unnamed protein product [Hermetia illucens]